MTQFKGTPGPWYCESNSRAIGPLIQDDDDQCFHMMEHVAYVEYQLNEDIQHSNARLIAAAPELLEALQMALEWIDAVPSDTLLPTMPGFDRDEVNSIITKATGETK